MLRLEIQIISDIAKDNSQNTDPEYFLLQINPPILKISKPILPSWVGKIYTNYNFLGNGVKMEAKDI